jgi:hypothetical protein
MKFILQRLFFTQNNAQGDYTCGYIAGTNANFRSFVIEDVFRAKKLKAETRIPAGTYKLGINKSDTPLTIKHRTSYGSWFKYHIQLLEVPNYQGVYVHAGNDDSHTEGCLLLNYAFDYTASDKPGSKSVIAVEAFYKLVYPLLEAGTACYIEIRDETF